MFKKQTLHKIEPLNLSVFLSKTNFKFCSFHKSLDYSSVKWYQDVFDTRPVMAILHEDPCKKTCKSNPDYKAASVPDYSVSNLSYKSS